ncbi:MAG: hypothetical protein DMF26_11625 [Verrucomicrobia bacterium]|nr:MAG: hypothetical protein DMF26_11625 [Verrucomicrobiota bacterium]
MANVVNTTTIRCSGVAADRAVAERQGSAPVIPPIVDCPAIAQSRVAVDRAVANLQHTGALLAAPVKNAGAGVIVDRAIAKRRGRAIVDEPPARVATQSTAANVQRRGTVIPVVENTTTCAKRDVVIDKDAVVDLHARAAILAINIHASAESGRIIADRAIIERERRMVIVDAAAVVTGVHVAGNAVRDSQSGNGDGSTSADVKHATLGVPIHSQVVGARP